MTQDLQVVQPNGVAIQQQEQGVTFLGIIAAAARDPQVDIAKMEGLLRMQQEIVAHEAKMAFDSAMKRLQPRLPHIVKKGRIDMGKGDKAIQQFAKYEDIATFVKPLMSEEGFSITFGTSPVPEGKGILITAKLSHSQGHSDVQSIPLPFDTSGSKNAIQAVGSTLSYGKRYLLCAMLDIVTIGEDNDGNLPPSLIDEKQENTILDMFAACNMDPASQAKFLEYMGVKTVGDIRAADFQKAMTPLNTKLRKMREVGQ